jgi:glycosyltransferase involved in cell wall biosynthesis
MEYALSVVIPVYNEEENIRLLHNSIREALSDLDTPWEVVYIDDGSSDDSLSVLESIAVENPETTTVIAFRRNFGQTAAVAAGIDFAHGEIIVLMDADMQNDPADIPLLLHKIDEGYDVVSGWRQNRQDAFISRTFPSRIANWLISYVTGVHLHDYGCTLKAYKREVITDFRLYGEMHRFIPAYAHSVGAKITEVPVTHHPRKYGETKYGINRTFKVILDLFTVKFLLSYSNKPIYLFGGVGMLMMAASVLMLGFLFIRKLLFQTSVVQSSFFLIGIMLMILGVQSILMGLIAELLARTYHESQHKPTYTIRRVINDRTS